MNIISIQEEQLKLAKTRLEWASFKAWVEQTKLFATIVAHSGKTFCEGVEGFEENSSIFLAVSNRKITTFEELPKEVLIEFYRNSPWYQSDLTS